MYLTDEREATLQDVITRISPDLFQKVTGLTVHDFELLLSIGIFNSQTMNGAIFAFKRFGESSLRYTGINKHQEEFIGGFDSSMSRTEYELRHI